MYSIDDFSAIPSARHVITDKLDLDSLPSIEDVRALANWTPEVLELFEHEYDRKEPNGFDRSAALSRLAYSGAELGWSDEQIMAAVDDADRRWGKYEGRRDRQHRLSDFVNRARAKIGYNPISDFTAFGLLKGTTPSDAPVESPRQDVWSYDEFLDQEFHIDWYLEGLLAANGIGLITGFPGTGKTQFALQMAHHMALGFPGFLKWQNTDGPKKVMFMSLEMGPNPLHLFLTTISGAYEGNLHDLGRNFKILPLGSAVHLDTKDGIAFLQMLMEEHQPDIVFIDSLQKLISKEMTDELAVKSLMEVLSLVRKKYSCAMCIIHHNRKKSTDAQDKIIEQSDVYGSVFIVSEVDFVLSLRKLNSQMLSVDMLKNRLGPETETFEIVRNEHLTFTLEYEQMMNSLTNSTGGMSIGV